MSRFGVFWLPWLTTAANGSCRLKSAAAIDAEDVPVALHPDSGWSRRWLGGGVVGGRGSKCRAGTAV